MAELFVVKESGETEPLNIDKIRDALLRAGAGRSLADEVIDEISPGFRQNMGTREIYRMAFDTLHALKPGAAARFGLKGALFRLGPDGHAFETFVSALLKGRGYETKPRQTLQGKCVSHEIDVVATRQQSKNWNAASCIIECKFHNAPSMRCHIQSALYSWARFLDVHERNPNIKEGWLATNTKFTTEAIQYSDCVGLRLLGWSFPYNESIQVRIEENKLYPLTVMHDLDRRTFELLHNAGIILVPDLASKGEEELVKLGIQRQKAEMLKKTAKQVLSSNG